ncbi:benzoate 1,2-dioxygenase electron transfer component BenC [Nocardia aurantia]|uniref:Na(+)-translocating NADH-quinone reductase subunit F n=1 Tax=Nocardia aurantia TaxID=2585199 RepID=A0A7K0DPF6_9NOCA|nr:benzoate 1,2-dioxygenase electron transfer component BenC [Nocardia aurantia]MQY27272.1 Na(+)-translocating NADH-quinone reductase subunit F [Nocardia aurantia]
MTVDTEVTTHRVALSFEDGVTRFITCRADQTVADASYRQRINIPLDCRDGACGTCKALCESGDYDGGTYIDDALAPDEAARGYVLPCSMRPRSDLVLQIASTSEIAKTQASSFTATVVGLNRLSATTVELAVEIPNRGDLAFLPGQYVNIAVPGTEVGRSYSFSNAPHEERLSFLIKITPGGAMSTYLTDRAEVGDELTFTGPHGSFFLRDTDRPVLLLAGGTGLAPILSMLRKLRADGSTRTAHLIYGVSADDDLVALDQIEQVAAELPGLTWDHVVTDPASTAENKGYVMSLIRSEHLYDGNVAVYLCGPPRMVESVRTHLADAGVEPAGFYYEKFALAVAGNDARTGNEAKVAVVQTIPPAEVLLEAADARAVAGQVLLPAADLAPWPGRARTSDPGDTVRRIAGQLMGMPAPGTEGQLIGIDAEADLLITGARAIAGQKMFPSAGDAMQPEPAVAPSADTAPDGYQIGEEHPDVQSSDALFEARQALELGALELTLGRLTSQQLAGYRLLAEATLPYVDGERFTDAAAYTESNATFHDYLFGLTGNDHLLQAYQALGVKGRMAEVLRNATWCHPRCATDHVEIVEAFEAGDRERARQMVTAHASRSKQTMRRAMAATAAEHRPRFITPGRFSGQVIIVTGAAQGIGAQVARRVAAEGGTLLVADRSELVGELARELDADPVICDLETGDGARTLIERAIERHGRVDVLINNVGGAINFKPFTEFTDHEIRAEIDRSLMTTLLACRAVLPGMVERRSGVIVNVSSAATRGIHRIPYSAAKGGVNAITASLALEYADEGIRVVATAPGGTEAPPRRISRGTPQLRGDRERAWFQAHIDQTLNSSPMHRYGTLDEQAAAITFLASPEASYITGTVLPVAGGDLG